MIGRKGLLSIIQSFQIFRQLICCGGATGQERLLFPDIANHVDDRNFRCKVSIIGKDASCNGKGSYHHYLQVARREQGSVASDAAPVTGFRDRRRGCLVRFCAGHRFFLLMVVMKLAIVWLWASRLISSSR